jgi:hypothetical protein
MLGPKGSGITYYRCVGNECKKGEECLFYLVLSKAGKITGYGCECAKVEFPAPVNGKGEACLKETSAEVPDKEGRKFYYRCKTVECTGKGKSCIFWVKDKDGDYVDSGCECKIWTAS